jgi:hypothetical protein
MKQRTFPYCVVGGGGGLRKKILMLKSKNMLDLWYYP